MVRLDPQNLRDGLQYYQKDIFNVCNKMGPDKVAPRSGPQRLSTQKISTSRPLYKVFSIQQRRAGQQEKLRRDQNIKNRHRCYTIQIIDKHHSYSIYLRKISKVIKVFSVQLTTFMKQELNTFLPLNVCVVCAYLSFVIRLSRRGCICFFI